ncbi:MAG: anti-sigma factor antagonist [Clostridia bacterium]|nr:anti-sigma factor antagonist [Clostridia bacterium]
MNSVFLERDKTLLVEITEEIDHHVADILRRKIDEDITRYMPRKVIFDFNKVSFMDSAGIGMVIGRYKMVNMIGGVTQMKNVRTSIKKIFEMSGVSKIIPIIDSCA